MRRNDREIIETEIIEEIIRKSDVCRIALANGSIPYIITMNFGFTGGPKPTFYFHCANHGKKLDMIKANNYVCFEVDLDHELYTGDNGCDWGMKFRSVVGYGNISIVTDQEEKEAGLNNIMRHYGGEGKYTYDEKVFGRTTILRLDVVEMTGKMC